MTVPRDLIQPPQDQHDSGAAVVPWGVGDAIVVWVLGFVGAVLIAVLFAALRPPELSEALANAILAPVSLMALALATVAWVGLRYRGSVSALLGRPPSGRDVLLGLGVGVAAVLVLTAGVGLALGLLLEVLGREIPTVQQGLRDAARDPQTAPLLVASALLVAPVCEELFFRGMVLPALAKRVGVAGGVVLSAVIFGVVHLNQAEDALGAVLLLARLVPLGLLFAWLYLRRGTLLVPILVHSVFNAASVVLLLAGIE